MSDVAAVKIPELEFEAPYGRQSFGKIRHQSFD
jgi:hypothetical protein